MKSLLSVITITIVLLHPLLAAENLPRAEAESAGRKGVPSLTVEELARDLRQEGFQWRFIGHQIAFTARVVNPGTAPTVRIKGLDEDDFNTAVIHNAPAESHFKLGDKVHVKGLIVDQAYGVWQIWSYGISPVPGLDK